MRARGDKIELMARYGAICFTFKEKIKRVFLIIDYVHWETFDMDASSRVILNHNGPWLFMSRHSREQIKHLHLNLWTYQLVVNFHIRDTYCDRLFELRAYFLEDLVQSAWHNASILVVLRGAWNRKSLAGSCLSVTHNRPIVTFDDWARYLLRTDHVDILLTTRIKEEGLTLHCGGSCQIWNPMCRAGYWRLLALHSSGSWLSLSKMKEKPTPLSSLIWMFLEAKLAVGRVRIRTLTACLTILLKIYL